MLDSTVMLLIWFCSFWVMLSFSLSLKSALFSVFLIASSASSRALERFRRACSKNSVPESLLTLTSWASP